MAFASSFPRWKPRWRIWFEDRIDDDEDARRFYPLKLEFDRLIMFPSALTIRHVIGNGWSAEEIIRQYPHLTAAEVHAALGYYFDHREEVDAKLSVEVAALDASDQQAPSPLRLRLLARRRGASA